MKEIVANEIAKRVKNGDVLGVGTGTTVDAALEAIGKRVAHEGLLVTVVPTSYQSAWRCQELGLTVMYSGYRGYLSWGFDGADQVTNERWAIKGKGGALLQEKILAKRCKHFIIIADDSRSFLKRELSLKTGYAGLERVTLHFAQGAENTARRSQSGGILLSTRRSLMSRRILKLESNRSLELLRAVSSSATRMRCLWQAPLDYALCKR
jgi:ribose 5-phosphate isomerase